MFLGITPFGMVHTLISLIAVAAGFIAVIGGGIITPRNRVGQTFVIATILTCLTGFFIFHHGGFGKAHVLGIVTLIVLAVALVATYSNAFGRASRYIEVIGYSLAFFLHFIPAITETATRVPAGHPWAASPDDPRIQTAIAIVFALFVLGIIWDLWRLRARR